jgi:AcrR family transcriptional regulator
MTATVHATNRGPAAAAENHAALLSAARQLFAERGYRVPLSAIARAAGVGQGSLYRHFPTRLDLALAIFEDNYTELEALVAGDPSPQAFHRLWQRLLELTVGSVAFIEVVLDARAELVDTGLRDRLDRILEGPLLRAQAAGEIDARLRVDDLALVLRMVYGVLVSEPDPSRARPAVARALGMVDPALTLERRPHDRDTEDR